MPLLLGGPLGYLYTWLASDHPGPAGLHRKHVQCRHCCPVVLLLSGASKANYVEVSLSMNNGTLYQGLPTGVLVRPLLQQM